jgi:hypothetical protein
MVTLHAIADHVAERSETAIMAIGKGGGYAVGNPNKATLKILNAP